jgi:hypothetical protein
MTLHSAGSISEQICMASVCKDCNIFVAVNLFGLRIEVSLPSLKEESGQVMQKCSKETS